MMRSNRIILYLLFLLFCSAFQLNEPQTMTKDKIIYVYDPMCGWCFGFGKVMSEFHAKNKDSFDFDVVSGGMVVGDREGPVGDFADYILGAYKRVEEYSGMHFGQPYLDQLKSKTLWSSSVKPAIAVEAFKEFNTKDVVEFSHAVQKAYFIDGKDLRNDEVYKNLARAYDINEDDFITKLNSSVIKDRTTEWFKTTSAWGISGYPTVIMVRNGKYYAVARGFTDMETLNKNIQSVVAAN